MLQDQIIEKNQIKTRQSVFYPHHLKVKLGRSVRKSLLRQIRPLCLFMTSKLSGTEIRAPLWSHTLIKRRKKNQTNHCTLHLEHLALGNPRPLCIVSAAVINISRSSFNLAPGLASPVPRTNANELCSIGEDGGNDALMSRQAAKLLLLHIIQPIRHAVGFRGFLPYKVAPKVPFSEASNAFTWRWWFICSSQGRPVSEDDWIDPWLCLPASQSVLEPLRRWTSGCVWWAGGASPDLAAAAAAAAAVTVWPWMGSSVKALWVVESTW